MHIGPEGPAGGAGMVVEKAESNNYGDSAIRCCSCLRPSGFSKSLGWRHSSVPKMLRAASPHRSFEHNVYKSTLSILSKRSSYFVSIINRCLRHLLASRRVQDYSRGFIVQEHVFTWRIPEFDHCRMNVNTRSQIGKLRIDAPSLALSS